MAEPVHVGDAALPWREGLCLADVVAAQGRAPESVASALNGEFVARERRGETPVAPGDRVTLFEAIVGG